MSDDKFCVQIIGVKELCEAMDEMDGSYKKLRGRSIAGLTDEELHTAMAFKMWDDDADWMTVVEMRKDTTLTREHMMNTLIDGFGIEGVIP